MDLSSTEVTEIMGSAFAHCKHLQHPRLPRKLRIIEQETFLKCTSLKEVSVPPTLLYIARRAFAGCTQLCQFQRVGKCVTWREHSTPEPMRFSSVTSRQLVVSVQSCTLPSLSAGTCVLYTFWECASDQDQDNHRTNRRTLPHTATNSGIYPTAQARP